MRKRLSRFTSFILVLFLLVIPFFQVKVKAKDDTIILRVYNSQDYIDDGKDDDGVKVGNSVCEDFEEYYLEKTGKTVQVIYETFETNETMLNALKIGKTSYDLVCTSEYAVQKMIEEDMLEKFHYSNNSYDHIPNYNEYGSPYLKELFEKEQMASFAVPYMWGTLGFIYDMDKVKEEDISTWKILWNKDYRNFATAKDSMRDTYVAGVMYVYYGELMELKDAYELEKITTEEYNTSVTKVMNRVDDDTLSLVKEALLQMKKNIYGFEVDNGKSDITTGRIAINLAWSGDAVYAIDSADEDTDGELRLGYKVPEEGSNIWSDDWVMPKGANIEVAEEFVNYLSHPEVAVRNMDYVGYTSAIAGDAVWETILDWYSQEDGIEVDLSYFFGGTLSEEYLTDSKAIITVNTDLYDRQFAAQYPTLEVVNRCAIMANFGAQNDKVITLWKDVKSGDFNTPLVGSLMISLVLLYVVGSIIKKYKKKNKHKLKPRKN